MNIEDLTLKQIKELQSLLVGSKNETQHQMVGRRCLVRTYSAGVHIGDVISVKNGMEVHLKNSLRLWKWEGGGLSLSAVATNGIVKGRLNETPEIVLSNAIEFIPTTPEAELTFKKWIEDKK